MKEIIGLRNKREKHFENGDGTITAYMYDHDVHFLKDGKYKDIDNTLIEKDNHYENKDNDFKVVFNKENDDLLDIHKEGHYLNMSLKDKKFIISKNKETIEYLDVEGNIDIDYKLIGNKIKESIILKSKEDVPSFLEFVIDTNLNLELNENGQIEVKDDKEVIFIIDSSFMIDNKKEINNNIIYNLTKENSKYLLKLELDKEWLQDEEREYPVIIDPTIIGGGEDERNENVFDTYITSLSPDLNCNKDEELEIGTFNSEQYGLKVSRALLKFILPSIGTGYNIINAYFTLDDSKSYGWMLPYYYKRMEVHAISTNWDETTATWNTMNDKYDEKVESLFWPDIQFDDYDPNTTNDTITKVDITHLVKAWYSGKTNNGIMIKSVDESYNQNERIYRPYSKTYDSINGTSNRPFLIITYVKQSGIRNDMTYTNVSFSNGSSSINNFTGNVTNSFILNKTISNKFPASIGIVYNTEDILITDNNTIAKGWKFTLEESLEKITVDQREYIKFKDSSNADYYFYKLEENKYKDEDGLNLTIEFKDNTYEMIDSTGNRKIFAEIDSKYLLTKIIDVELNEVNIIYTNGKLTQIKDANDEEINITYASDLITLISTYDTAKININNNLITSLGTKNGTVIFNYNSNNLISKINDINETSVSFEYYDVSPYKLHKITNYGLNNEKGKTITFTYEAHSTSIIDDEERKTVYIFDTAGHTLNSIMYPKGIHKLKDAYVNENAYYVYPEFENQKNKLANSNPSIKYVNNLLVNGRFERELNECNFSISGGCTRRQVNNQESGEYSLYFPSNAEIMYDIKDEDDYTLRLHLSMIRMDGHENISLSLYMENNGTKMLIDNFFKEAGELESYQEYDIEFSGHFLSNSKLILTCNHGEDLSMYLDNLYLEKGIVANIKNLIENGDFSNSTHGWNISGPEESENFYSIIDLSTGEKALKINSNTNKSYVATQNLYLTGKSGDTYRLSFWYKNEGVTTLASENQGVLVNLQTFSTNPEEGFCPELAVLNSNSYEWEYFSHTFTIPFDYNEMLINIMSLCEANSLYITNIMLIKDPRNITYDYDKEGNLISSTGLNNETSNLKYDENNQLISSFNPKGNNFKYEYDNKVTDRVLKGISPTGISNEIKYDYNGNPVKTLINNVNPDGILKADGNYHIRLKGTEKYVSGNFKNNMITIEEDNCNHQHFKILKIDEEFYRIQTGYKYLSVIQNQVILSKTEDDNTLFKISINDNGSYTISPKKELLKVIGSRNDKLFILEKEENDGTNEFFFEDIDTPLFIESKSYYTPDGRFITCVEDSLGKKTQYNINEKGLLISTVNAKGIETLSTYNDKDQITSITNNNKIVNYEYNSQNLLSKIISGKKEYSFTYDNFFKTKNIKLNNSLLTENTYENNNGNLIKSKYGNGFEIEYTYDELERIKTVTKENKIFTYHYDNFGNVAKILSDDEKYSYSYGLGQQLLTYIYNNEFRIDLEYDKNNNVLNKKYILNNNYNFNINYEYNKDDSIIKITLDNNNINYNYDYLGRLVSKNINNNLNVEYTYITNGDKTSLVLDTMKIDNDLYKYIYDDLYNITHIYLNNKVINEYEYDDINELISEKDYILNRSYKYIYDSEGNILKKQEYILDTHILVKEDKYEYNNPNWEDQLTKFNDTSITYDEIGNPLTIGDTVLTWTNGRQLNTYKDGTTNVSYKYDINGIRMSKTVNGTETKYYTEGNKIIFELRGQNVIYYIRDEYGELIGLKYNNRAYFYKKNYQGDIIGIYDSNYNLIVNYTYDSWGNIISIIDNNKNTITDTNNIGIINPFRYRSYYYDTETKLYYLNSRYYNPLWGRFINADVILNNGILGLNLYSYCENNCTTKQDPKGKFVFEFCVSLVGGAISAGIKIADNITHGEKWNKDVMGAFAGGFVGTFSAMYGMPTGVSTFIGAATTNIVNEATSYTSIAGLNGQQQKEINYTNINNSVNNVIINTAQDTISSYVSSQFTANLIPINNKSWIKPSKLSSSFVGKYAMRHHRQNLIDSVGNYLYEIIKEIISSGSETKEIPIFCECND